jgi:hypothetical protein
MLLVLYIMCEVRMVNGCQTVVVARYAALAVPHSLIFWCSCITKCVFLLSCLSCVCVPGMAGFGIIADVNPSPWNIDAMPTAEWILKDILLDDKCELRFSHTAEHSENM